MSESPTTVVRHSELCIEKFKQLAEDLGAQNAVSVVVGVLSDRFDQWTIHLGVFAKERVSLDARLRYSESLRSIVMRYLDIIADNLELSKWPFLVDGFMIHIDGYIVELQQHESPSGDEDETSRTVIDQMREPVQGLSSLLIERLQVLESAVDGLYRLGVAIRQSSSSNLTQRIRNFLERRDDGMLEARVLIRLKYQLIDNIKNIATSMGNENADTTGASLSLCEQLAKSVSYRYFSILYHSNHAEKIEERDPNMQSKRLQKLPVVSNTVNSHQSPIQVTNQNPSALPRRLLPNTPLSDTDPSIPESKMVMAKFASSGRHPDAAPSVISIQPPNVNYPAPPKILPTEKDALCPYCRQRIPKLDCENKRRWERHVEKDFEFYTCISEECSETPQLFNNFHEWKRHMDKEHTTKWVQRIHRPLSWCCECGHEEQWFTNKSSFVEHVANQHREHADSPKLEMFTEWCEVRRPRTSFTCPVCNCIPEKLSLVINGHKSACKSSNHLQNSSVECLQVDETDELRDELIRHIAEHVKQVGFLSLAYVEDNINEDRKSSGKASGGTREDPTPLVDEEPSVDEDEILAVPGAPYLLNAEIDWLWKIVRDTLRKFQEGSDLLSDPKIATFACRQYLVKTTQDLRNLLSKRPSSSAQEVENSHIPLHTHEDYMIAWICCLPNTNLVVAREMLDVIHPPLGQHKDDANSYALGRIGSHNIVITCLPASITGNVSATTGVMDLLNSYPAIRFGLMVGIGGGAPFYRMTDKDNDPDEEEDEDDDFDDSTRDIRLGDVVIGLQSKATPAIVQCDFGKSVQEGEFIRDSTLNRSPKAILTAVSYLQSLDVRRGHNLQAHLTKMYEQNPALINKFTYPSTTKDRLFRTNVSHVKGKKSCGECCGVNDANVVKRANRSHTLPKLHYGTIGSVNAVMKNSVLRDKWARSDGICCFEMEAAGLMNSFPCLVIRGICDYSDSHRNKIWQPYAAATAAAYAKELLYTLSPLLVSQTKSILDHRTYLSYSSGSELYLMLILVNACQMKCTQLTKWQGPVLEALSVIDETVKQQLKTQERHHLTEQQMRCLQTFRTTDYVMHKDINPERVPGTCLWVLKDPNYTQWLTNRTNKLLWLSADPGCGKSVLSRCLIDEMLISNEQEQESTTVCYFFFKDNDGQDNLAAALCAVLHQLFSTNPELISYALNAWERNGKMLTTDITELWHILNDAACDSGAPSVICIFDALDECNNKDRRRFLSLLSKLCSSPELKPGHRSLRVFLTSRPYDDIDNGLLDCSKIRLSGEEKNDEIKKEINLVIRFKLDNLAKVNRLSNFSRERLGDWLFAMEHRTYLWLYLAFDGIQEKYKYALQPDLISLETLQLPDTINKAYEHILANVEDQALAKVILRTIVGARRPLKIAELAIALGLGLRSESTSYEDFKIEENDLEKKIRSICGLFIFVNNSRVYLIHQTAKEFLVTNDSIESTRCWKGCLSSTKTEEFMAKICIDFLSLDEFDSLDRDLLDQFLGRKKLFFNGLRQDGELIPGPWNTSMSVMNTTGGQAFWKYVAENWTVHFRECVCSRGSQLLKRAYNLYEVKETRFQLWFACSAWKLDTDVEYLHMNKERLAAFNGHVEILRLLSNTEEFDPISMDETGRTALYWGSHFGHKAVIEFLTSRTG